MHPIKRGYLQVGGRRVHYRRLGAGPPLVMLHGSPGDSAMLEPEMAAASAHFTCIALDTPGFGGSDPLPGDVLTVADLAGATAEAMAALGLPACRVYGTHTGAAIGVELGAGWPERVSGLVLEGLPMFTEAETKVLFEGYFARMVPDPLAGHLTRTWMRFRDQFTWFPWTARHVSRLNPVDRPTPDEIQHWVMMYNYARKTYLPAYRAACFYGREAYRAAELLARPAVYMATEEDMLFGHLDRLPPLKAQQRVVRLPYDTPAKHQAIVRFLREIPSEGRVAPVGTPLPVGVDPALQFFDAPDGQIFTRCYGDPVNPAVILLHDAPGTGLALEGLARRLSQRAYVVLPDLPGTGESAAPTDDRDILAVSARALASIADALGLTRFFIAATGCGAAVAAHFAGRDDPRLMAIIVEQLPVPDESVATAIAPDLPLSPEGAHWLKLWLMLRDGQIYRPWFDGSVRAQRRSQGNFDAEWLHDQTFAVMKSRTSYHRLPRAAFRFDNARALGESAAPVSIAADGAFENCIAASLIQGAVSEAGVS